MPFRMSNTQVLFISVVPAGANKRQVVFKAAGIDNDGRVFERTFAVRKADDARQVIYGIAYPVGSPTDTDTQGDYAEAAEVEAMAYDFMAKGRTAWGVDRDHSYRALDAAYVAESWLVRKGDPLFGAPEDLGAWAVGIKVADKALYNELKKTGYRGLSIAGTCEREEVAKTETKTAGENGGWLAKIRRLLRKEDTVDELKKAIEEVAAAVKALTEKVDAQEKAANKSAGGSPAPAANQPAGGEATGELAKLTAAVKALETKLAALEGGSEGAEKAAPTDELTKSLTALSERIAKLEKATPGSAQNDQAAKTEKRGMGIL